MRVSTDAQDHDSQRHALLESGVHAAAIFAATASGRGPEPPELAAAIATLEPGDELIVMRLDRLTRRGAGSLHGVLARVEQRGARVRSLSEPWCDPESPVYDLLISVFGWVAKMEADRIRARSLEGIAAARARGVQFGAPRAWTALQQAKAVEMLRGGATCREVSLLFDVSPSTVQRLRRAQGIP